jgi:hypothetical protein
MTIDKVELTSPSAWELIQVIAKNQATNPLRTIKELVDNALGSEATTIVVEIRKKGAHRESPRVIIRDDGKGWQIVTDPKDPNYGLPNLWYTVSHIAHSIKTRSDEHIRKRDAGLEVGQFGIGMLSFWALGQRMTVTTRSRLPDGSLTPSARMIWYRGNPTAEIEGRCAKGLESAGTEIVVDELIRSQLSLINGKTVAEHLSNACRAFLKRTGAKLLVDDHGKIIEVKPSKFEGTRVQVKKIDDLELELYIPPSDVDRNLKHVAVFRKSEKVMDDVSLIPDLSVSPWNDGRVYGTVSFPKGTINPDRNGFVNDDFKAEFIESMVIATKSVLEFVGSEERRLRDLKSNEMARLFEEKWQLILKELPETWRRITGQGPGPLPPQPPKGPIGPLDYVEISPSDGRVAVNSDLVLKAVTRDAAGNSIARRMLYSWEVVSGASKGDLLGIGGREVTFHSGPRKGIVTVLVSAVENGTVKKCSTNVHIVESLPPPPPPPPPPPADRPPSLNYVKDLTGPRSQFKKQLNTVDINELHPDYQKAEESGSEAKIRYLYMCFSKEIAVDRWGQLLSQDQHGLGERIMELTLLAEKTFGLRPPEIPKKRGRPPKQNPAA